MAHYYPLSDARLVQYIKLWGKFVFPVYEFSQIQDEAGFNSFINESDGSFIYGNEGEVQSINFITEPRKNFIADGIAWVEEYYGISSKTETISEEISFGNGKKMTKYTSHYSDVSSTSIAANYYGKYEFMENGVTRSIMSWSRIRSYRPNFDILSGDYIRITDFSGGPGGFIRVKIGDTYKYARVYLSLNYFFDYDERGDRAWPINLNNNIGAGSDRYTRGIYFYECRGYTLLGLDEIAGGATVEDLPYNPYEPGGPSGPGDLPPGTFDDNSDPIPDSSLPTISSANTGFTRIYNPTLSQVQALASYLWTTPDVIETIWNHIKQFFENPMEAMIGFNLVPVPVPNGGTTNFKLMYIDTGVQMTAAASQFVDRDCGTLKIERYYGSALDQSPYTKISCFLPYIGTVQLNTDEVMGTTLQVKYRVDICSGSCVAKIFVDGSCLYQYSGHCAIPIPFSAADFSSYVSAAVSVAKLAIGAATAGVAGVAAGAIPTAAQQTNQVITQATTSPPGSNLPALIPTRSQITEAPSDQSSTEASFSGISPSSISNTVGEIMTSKPHVEHSGSFSGNTGYLGIRRPYVIIERPNMCMPAQYQHFNGFPAMISMELSTCKGYTRIQQVQLTGMTATNPEQAEILELLKSGVVF